MSTIMVIVLVILAIFSTLFIPAVRFGVKKFFSRLSVCPRCKSTEVDFFSRPTKYIAVVTECECGECGHHAHDADANYCKFCGEKL